MEKRPLMSWSWKDDSLSRWEVVAARPWGFLLISRSVGKQRKMSGVVYSLWPFSPCFSPRLQVIKGCLPDSEREFLPQLILSRKVLTAGSGMSHDAPSIFSLNQVDYVSSRHKHKWGAGNEVSICAIQEVLGTLLCSESSFYSPALGRAMPTNWSSSMNKSAPHVC